MLFPIVIHKYMFYRSPSHEVLSELLSHYSDVVTCCLKIFIWLFSLSILSLLKKNNSRNHAEIIMVSTKIPLQTII